MFAVTTNVSMPFLSFSSRNKLRHGLVLYVIRWSPSQAFWSISTYWPFCAGFIANLTRYVDHILRSTSQLVEQVTIEPDGRWSEVTQKETPGSNDGQSSDDEDDDLVEIQNMPRLTAIKDEAFPTPTSMARTPPYSSREQSSSSAAPRSHVSKRPISQVIDLTFSSDEEDQGQRASKRQATGSCSAGLPNTYTYTGTPIKNSLPGLNGHPFTLSRLAPSRPPDPLS